MAGVDGRYCGTLTDLCDVGVGKKLSCRDVDRREQDQSRCRKAGIQQAVVSERSDQTHPTVEQTRRGGQYDNKTDGEVEGRRNRVSLET